MLLGKFLPPHDGHLHLIREAARQVDALTVLVCTLDGDPIPGALRAAWVRECAPPGVRVVHVAEPLPQTPEEHPDFWPIWVDVVRRHAGPVDVVFTSEDYGDPFARHLGCQHVCVDRARRTVPVSGTAVRHDPWAAWERIPPPVRAYYARRVALVGPESTGKTTLAAALAAHFGTTWVAEYGREHTAGMDTRPGTPDLTPDDIRAIAREQPRREDAAARAANRLLFCDTDVLVTATWGELYFGTCPPEVRAAAREAARAGRYALTLLLDTDVAWTDDGTRAHAHARRWHFERLRALLEEDGRPYVVVSGTGPARLAAAAAAVEGAVPEAVRHAGR